MPLICRPRRAGFTLAELLIVIAIIAILVTMLMPALTMVRAQANEVKCESNMRQIAMSVEIYRNNANLNYPDSFQELVTLYNLTPKVLLCPLDASRGTDPNMGRTTGGGWSDYSRLYYQAVGSTSMTSTVVPVNTQPALTSYDFEANGFDSAAVCTSSDIAWFYYDLPPSQYPAAGTVAWSDLKEHEQQNGNVDPVTGAYPQPFPTSSVPILRCYHHWDWNKALQFANSPTDYPAKVVNLAMDFNTIMTIPYWEAALNPLVQVAHNER